LKLNKGLKIKSIKEYKITEREREIEREREKEREKWFINLLSVNFPSEVQGLLQLGESFCSLLAMSSRSSSNILII